MVTISEKYEPLFEWLSASDSDRLGKVDTVIITGGRYSQKSFGTGLFSCIAAKDFNHRILYTRYTLAAAEDSIIPEFSEKIDILECHDAFEIQKDRISGKFNQSKIVFRGIKTSSGNQTANLKSLKNFSIFILEEAEEMPSFEMWDKIKKSIRALDVKNLNVLILNPTTKEHWVYSEFFEARGINEGFNGISGNVLYIHSTYLDMERQFIADSIYEDFAEKRADYLTYEGLKEADRYSVSQRVAKNWRYYKHVVLGGWLSAAEGVIYTNWSIGQYEEPTPPVYGQDFGFSVDPTTLIKVSIDKSRKKIFVKELLYKPKLVTSMIISENKRLAGNGLIYADSAEPRLIEEIRKAGVNIKETVKGQGSVTAGIALLQDYELIVDPESVNTIKELNNYVWHDKKSGVPVDAWNHSLDSLRYATFPTLSKRVISWGVA
jgi:phage terminase large subunit